MRGSVRVLGSRETGAGQGFLDRVPEGGKKSVRSLRFLGAGDIG